MRHGEDVVWRLSASEVCGPSCGKNRSLVTTSVVVAGA